MIDYKNYNPITPEEREIKYWRVRSFECEAKKKELSGLVRTLIIISLSAITIVLFKLLWGK
jgi:hypothetical protein